MSRRKLETKTEMEGELSQSEKLRETVRNSQSFEKFMKSHHVHKLSLKAQARLLDRKFFQNEQELLIQEIVLPNRRLGINICLFGDLHADENTMPVEKINELSTVLAKLDDEYDFSFYAFVGDLINDSQEHMIPKACSIFKDLPKPCFAVLGNHDHNGHSEEIIQSMQDANVQVLDNQHIKLDDIYIAGVDCWWKNNHDFDKALAKLTPKQLERTIMLGHEPILGTMHECYLHLAGHSHAGQIAWPKKKPLLFPPGSKPFVRGLYDVDDTRYVYTTAGLGTSAFPLRVYAKPEITILSI